jgi:hypothetical protein
MTRKMRGAKGTWYSLQTLMWRSAVMIVPVVEVNQIDNNHNQEDRKGEEP